MATPKKLNPKNKGGPKVKFKITPEVLKQIEVYASQSLTQQEMCALFKVGHTVWYERIKQHPEMATAIELGKAKIKSMYTSSLAKAAREGNVVAIKFFLATQHKWTETSKVEVTGTNAEKPALTITVNDPVEAAKIYQQIMSGS